MKTVVIYHRADFDGIFCREIARKFLLGAELIGWDYGDPEPVIDPNDYLYILDLSVPSLMDHTNLVWIDHHKTAIDKYSPYIGGYRIDGVAACRLTWQWFSISEHNAQNQTNEALQISLPNKQAFVDRTVSEPVAVRLAGEYDIWDKRDPDSELFQHGLRSRNISVSDWLNILKTDYIPTISEVEKLLRSGKTKLWLRPDGTIPNQTVLELLESGKAIQYAKNQENAEIIKAYGYTIEFEGLKFLACNHARFNSHLFTDGLTPEHDACLGYNFTGKHFRVSLYHAPGKEHHDLSVIAKKYGGGGHRGACGFTAKDIPFPITQ